MNKKPNTDISKTRTFSRHEKEMGLHLLTLPKASVNVISQMVPYESSHLYPKLAGANWTCYITNDIVRLGRVPTENKPANNKRLIDVDFGANKQISRRHADIKYNSRKNYWELRVYGKIGVKVNHRLVTKKDRPVPLTTMAYLDIGGNEFIFILPEVTDIKPNKSRVTTVPEPNDDNKNDTNNTNNNNNDNMEASLDNEQDHQLLAFIVEVFESSNNKDLSTEQIFKKVLDQCRKQSIDTDQYTMDMILRILVIDTRFRVAEKSLELSVEMADKVQWIIKSALEEESHAEEVGSGALSDAWSDFGYEFAENTDQVKSYSTPQTTVPTTESSSTSSTSLWPTETTESNLTSAIIPNPPLFSNNNNNNNENENENDNDSIAHPITESMKDSNSSTSHSAYVSLISSPSDTIATTPSVLSTTHPSPAERTLSTLSTTSISNTATLPHPNTNINANTNINTITNTNDTIHSNNKSLPYSTANAYHVSTSTSPFWIGSAYSRGISIESIYSSMINNKNQTGHHSILKRKLSISDQEDQDIWLRFRTTNFRAQS